MTKNIDIMVDKGKLAKDKFECGCNCAQAVALAFKDEIDMEEEAILRLASSFGGGMGKLEEVCGALTGSFIVAGILYGDYDPLDSAGKSEHYSKIRALGEKFKTQHGTYICRELLEKIEQERTKEPEERTPEDYKRRKCSEYVYSAAEALESYYNEDWNR